MAIARNSVGTSTNSGAVTNPSQTFNNVAGNFIVSSLICDKNATISSPTYAGAAMTAAGEVTMTGWVYKVALFYRINPATGSNTVAYTLSGSAQATLIHTASYSGVATTTPVDSSNTNYVTGAISSVTVSLNPTTSTGWMVAVGCPSGGGTLSGGTNTTFLSGFTTFNTGLMDTNGTIAAGAQTLGISGTANFTSSEGAAMVGISFKDATPAYTATPDNRMYFL